MWAFVPEESKDKIMNSTRWEQCCCFVRIENVISAWSLWDFHSFRCGYVLGIVETIWLLMSRLESDTKNIPCSYRKWPVPFLLALRKEHQYINMPLINAQIWPKHAAEYVVPVTHTAGNWDWLQHQLCFLSSRQIIISYLHHSHILN